MGEAINLPSTGVPRDALGASVLASAGVGITGGVPVAPAKPSQIVGLTPMYNCLDDEECRQIYDRFCCTPLNVFATSGALTSTYTNDINSFLVDFALYRANVAYTSVIWRLQKCYAINGVETWVNMAVMNNNAYGKLYAIGTITSHKSYTGYWLNWSKVLDAFGEGTYRVRVVGTTRGLAQCLYSSMFFLREFDCNLAHQSVKFESWVTGKIGSCAGQGRVFDLCGMTWHDSVRLQGFFGYEKITEWHEVMVKYPTGQEQRVHDEAIQTYQFISGWFEKEYHDRLKIYGLMCKTTKVSDYNINNSDYNIKQLPVIKAGNYEPEYKDKDWRRISKVTIPMKPAIQNIIQSNCCPAK